MVNGEWLMECLGPGPRVQPQADYRGARWNRKTKIQWFSLFKRVYNPPTDGQLTVNLESKKWVLTQNPL